MSTLAIIPLFLESAPHFRNHASHSRSPKRVAYACFLRYNTTTHRFERDFIRSSQKVQGTRRSYYVCWHFSGLVGSVIEARLQSSLFRDRRQYFVVSKNPHWWYPFPYLKPISKLRAFKRALLHHNFQGFTDLRARYISAHVRYIVWHRDHHRCVRCGSHEKLEIGHIIPFADGGANSVDNLEILCQRCNRTQGRHILPSRPHLPVPSHAVTS